TAARGGTKQHTATIRPDARRRRYWTMVSVSTRPTPKYQWTSGVAWCILVGGRPQAPHACMDRGAARSRPWRTHGRAARPHAGEAPPCVPNAAPAQGRVGRRDADRTRSARRLTEFHDRMTRVVMADCHERAAMENELSHVIETLPGLVWTTLPDGRIDFLNHRWCEYTGLSLEEAWGW